MNLQKGLATQPQLPQAQKEGGNHSPFSWTQRHPQYALTHGRDFSKLYFNHISLLNHVRFNTSVIFYSSSKNELQMILSIYKSTSFYWSFKQTLLLYFPTLYSNLKIFFKSLWGIKEKYIFSILLKLFSVLKRYKIILLSIYYWNLSIFNNVQNSQLIFSLIYFYSID